MAKSTRHTKKCYVRYQNHQIWTIGAIGFLHKNYDSFQMKATDIRDKTSSHSSQNLRGRTLSFLAIYVLVTCGPVAPHCARMTNFIKHQILFSSQCTTSPIFKLISITVWILWHFEKVPFCAPLGVISLFPFSWGGGAPQTPSHISSFDPLGVRNNQHQ